MEGVIPVIASILRTTTTPVDVVCVGDTDVNSAVQKHFGKRIHKFTSLTVKDIEEDLKLQGIRPIWTWTEWHASIDTTTTNNNDHHQKKPKAKTNDAWFNENTVRPGGWDQRAVHAHELNHLRFYLPHLTMFRHRPYLFFVDDDVVVQSDIHAMAVSTMQTLGPTKGLVSPCSLWKWNGACQTFQFRNQEETIFESPTLYGGHDVCHARSDAETDTAPVVVSDCVPANYNSFLRDVTPDGAETELAWNFGFSLFALANWRDLHLTDKYESVMKESYRRHVFPETSLTFGLGVAFLALAGAVECWHDTIAEVRDGMGFLDSSVFESTFGPGFLSTFDVLHYTAETKPWNSLPTVDADLLEPWIEILREEGLTVPPQLPTEPASDLFAMIGTIDTDIDRVMHELDRHPQICASGSEGIAEVGFPPNLMNPEGISWIPTCSVRKGCSLEFVQSSILELTQNHTSISDLPPRCRTADSTADPLGRHLHRICNFVEHLKGDYTPGSISRLYTDAYLKEDNRFLGCRCKRGAVSKIVNLDPQWLTYQGYPDKIAGSALLDLNQTSLVGSKMIRIKRGNIWGRVKARLLAEATQIWEPRTLEEKEQQIGLLNEKLNVDIDSLGWRVRQLRDIDRAGDEWVTEKAAAVLNLDYDECKSHAAVCLGKILDFLGVDEKPHHAIVKEMSQSLFSPLELDSTMDYISNKEQVEEALKLLGVSDSIGL
jgi:hypothetical protein